MGELYKHTISAKRNGLAYESVARNLLWMRRRCKRENLDHAPVRDVSLCFLLYFPFLEFIEFKLRRLSRLREYLCFFKGLIETISRMPPVEIGEVIGMVARSFRPLNTHRYLVSRDSKVASIAINLSIPSHVPFLSIIEVPSARYFFRA